MFWSEAHIHETLEQKRNTSQSSYTSKRTHTPTYWKTKEALLVSYKTRMQKKNLNAEPQWKMSVLKKKNVTKV